MSSAPPAEEFELDSNGELPSAALRCRMYEQRFPEVDDLVMVQVRSIAEMGAYVSLLEYDNIEGMILLSELSRRRIRSVNKLIRVGRKEVVVVLRVDKEKGYIDLSKRRVTGEDIAQMEQKWSKSNVVHSIMRHVAKKTATPVETVYRNVGWPLYKSYGHAYNAFKLAVAEPDKVLEGLEMTPEIKAELMKDIARRLTPQAVKIRADLELTCFKYEGINAIKTALRAGLKMSTEAMPVQIKLVAPPLYVVTTTSLDRDEGIALLRGVCTAIEESIKEAGGEMSLKEEARAVSEKDEKLLSSLLESLEQQNREVDGDDDDDE